MTFRRSCGQPTGGYGGDGGAPSAQRLGPDTASRDRRPTAGLPGADETLPPLCERLGPNDLNPGLAALSQSLGVPIGQLLQQQQADDSINPSGDDATRPSRCGSLLEGRAAGLGGRRGSGDPHARSGARPCARGRRRIWRPCARGRPRL